MQGTVCQRCGNPIYGQSVSERPGLGPMHPDCWEDYKENMWTTEEMFNTDSLLTVDLDENWTKELPQEPGYYWRSDDGEEIDGLYEIAYDSRDHEGQLQVIYSPHTPVKVSYFEGAWWLGSVSRPEPPKAGS